jgi:MFS family permease
VVALFVVTYGTSTPLAAYGVFLPVLAEQFAWSRGAIATALSINLLLGGVAGFVIGALADRHGPRVILTVTGALGGTAFALVSTVDALWKLYLFVGVLGGVGMSSFYLLASMTVTHWFQARRGLALALVLVGFNMGYISGGPLAAWLIGALGWRQAYALLGGGCGLVVLLAAATVRLPRGREVDHLDRGHRGRGSEPLGGVPGVTLRAALADPRQWLLNVSWFLLGGLVIMVSVHVVPFARDQGIGLAAASLVLTAYGVGAVTGRVTAGAMSDRFGPRTTLRVGYVLQLVALTALLWVSSRELLMLVLALFGAGFAASDTMITRIIPEVFGLRAIGAILGVLSLGWRCGAALGPAVAGFVYDATGSYTLPFGAAPAAVVISWILFALATRAGRPVPVVSQGG